MIEMYNSDGFCLLTGECTQKGCYENGCNKCAIYKNYKEKNERI